MNDTNGFCWINWTWKACYVDYVLFFLNIEPRYFNPIDESNYI